MSYHVIINFRVFDRNLWEEYTTDEKPLLIYNVKQRLRWKLMSTLDQAGKVIKPKRDDKTFMELSFKEISIDTGKMCTIYKYKQTTWRNAKAKLVRRGLRAEPIYEYRTSQTI